MFAGAGLLFAGFTLLVRRWGLAPMPATAALSVVPALVALPACLVVGDPSRLVAIGAGSLLRR